MSLSRDVGGVGRVVVGYLVVGIGEVVRKRGVARAVGGVLIGAVDYAFIALDGAAHRRGHLIGFFRSSGSGI